MTPTRIPTPSAPTPADQPPDDLAWITRHWKGLATMATVLASAGYLVVSPGQRFERLSDEIRHSSDVQGLKDKAQDDRIDRLQDITDTGLREVREDVRDLILAQCLKSPESIVRARLKCASRLNGER